MACLLISGEYVIQLLPLPFPTGVSFFCLLKEVGEGVKESFLATKGD
jgi:hypothetical protein